MRNALIIIGTLAALAGCKKDAADNGKGTGTGTKVLPVKPPPRPSQGQLLQLPKLELAADPLRPQKIELGHALFFDKRLSVDGTLACVSCHQNVDGNGGHDPTAIGPGGKVLTRHSPVIWNVAWFKNSLSWDGRSATLEDQAKAALTSGNMGVPPDKLDAKVAQIAKIPGYKKLFEAAFPKQAPTVDLLAQGLAEYERTLLCTDTAYDKFAAGDKAALDEAQQRGLDVFMVKGGCMTCHVPPFFSSAMNVDNGQYFNAGIGTKDKAEADVDPGRMNVTKVEGDWAAFKPPSLRNIAKSAPYFHDGSGATLDEAIALMAGGGIANKNKSALFQDRGLTDAEKADLKAFLGGLDCPQQLEEPKLP